MSLIITSEPKQDYLLIESKGNLSTAEDLMLQSEMVQTEALKYNFTKILFNEIETILPEDLSPYFDLVKNYSDSVKPELRNVQLAVVMADKYKEFGLSWETISQSLGLKFNVFTSYKDAEAFLLKDTGGKK